MSVHFITTIAVNLGILLLVSWALGFVIFIRLVKDNSAFAKDLEKAQQQLKEAQQASPTAASVDPEYPLEPVLIREEEESSYLLHAIDSLNHDLTEKDHKLAVLSQLYDQQQALLTDWQGTDIPAEFIGNQENAQALIQQLQTDMSNSLRTISELENKLQEGQDKDSRIAILEETERRLRDRIRQIKNNQEQTSTLAEGLKKANNKNRELREANEKLKRSIKELSHASEEQLSTIRTITQELDKVSKLERYQKDVINDLEKRLTTEKSSTNDATKVQELEQQIHNISDTLERTVKEKEFVETYLLEMDKALAGAKETEQALERARKEIETLEMYFPEFEPDKDIKEIKDQASEGKTLARLEVTAAEQPELYNLIEDNRLFGILQEFWMTLDTPPLQLLAQHNIERPQQLSFWVKTDIHKNQFFVVIGITKALSELLAEAIFNDPDTTTEEGDQQDALGEIGNIIAGTLANELNPDYVVGISEHIDKPIDEQLEDAAIAAEVLLSANDQPIYMALLKPTINTDPQENKEPEAESNAP